MTATPRDDLAAFVDPFIGTDGAANCFPGPCTPFGMVQPGPDSGDGSRVWCSGYKHSDATIRGFSQTHLSGTGRPGMGDLRLFPLSAKTNPGHPVEKISETAEAGYYAVTLGGGVRCEATATERCALWRFSWPEGAARRLLVDGAAMLMQPWNAKLGPTVPESSFSLGDDRRTMLGGKTALGWTPYTLFWAIRFDRPWANAERLPRNPFEGAGDRFVLDFGGGAAGALEVRVALSTVSAEAAAATLASELGERPFDDVRAACRAAWNTLFARARLVRGTDAQKRKWYTALYHCCVQPNVVSDPDGRYLGDDGQIHASKRGHYSTLSLWDTFRAVHPLYTLLVPERVPAFVDSILATGREHGHLPTWAMWGRETHCMVGIHAIAVIADAWSKGFRDFDADAALALMVKSLTAFDAELPNACWNAIWENGYVPWKPGVFDRHVPQSASVTVTLETAYDFGCVARFAEWLGNAAAAREARKWSGIWRNLFDAKTGFFRPRAAKSDGGSFREPFDPCASRVPGAFWPDYTEQTPWINLWFVPHDADGLAGALGGREAAVAKLDEFFATPPPASKIGGNSADGGRLADGSLRPGQIGQDWHGNEPSLHIPFLYTLFGRRDKTAAICRRIAEEFYTTAPDGICGNDDCGALSAWYLFATMGFYPVDPCGAGYVLGDALAEEIRLALPGGGTLVVRGRGKAPAAQGSAPRLDGAALDGPTVSHAQLLAGGTLDFGC
ncbi:MAG: GH92 family glycosyl hydrolase [Kiritimatiellae bacterium]|nr:GH92 family glycosyl hydrolase [Kiritimatiellia bacterium]